jgi:protein SCO1
VPTRLVLSFRFLETAMKMNRKLVIGALVLTGAGLTGLGAMAAPADDPAESAAMESQHDGMMAGTQAAAADDAADGSAMQMQHHEMMAGMQPSAAEETADGAAMQAPHHEMMAGMQPSAAEDATDGAAMHAHHHDMTNGILRSTAEYTLPAITLVRDDGKTVSLVDELNDGRPVILTFIYTTCTTICPMVSQTFEELQGKLGGDRDKVHLVSISIDPEQDTPARLRAYAARFDAGPEWQHYTGTVEASVAAQRAFNVYRGDKMNHTAVAFFRAAPGKPWLRLDGLATPAELLSAYHDVVASN